MLTKYVDYAQIVRSTVFYCHGLTLLVHQVGIQRYHLPRKARGKDPNIIIYLLFVIPEIPLYRGEIVCGAGFVSLLAWCLGIVICDNFACHQHPSSTFVL